MKAELKMEHACTLPRSSIFKYYSETLPKMNRFKLFYIYMAAICKWNSQWTNFYKVYTYVSFI